MTTGQLRLLYRPEEAAGLLAISRTRVYELIARGELASLKIGPSRRITREAIDDFIARMAQNTQTAGH